MSTSELIIGLSHVQVFSYLRNKITQKLVSVFYQWDHLSNPNVDNK